PAFMGGAADFLLAPMITDAFKELTSAVRTGTTQLGPGGSVAPENPAWVQFARSMAAMMTMPAQLLAQHVGADPGRKLRVLAIAAGHGMFGIAIGKAYPNAEIVALDWPNVLEVAKENAAAAGLADRYSTIAGSAFDVEFGSGYDVVLLTNFLHHFDPPTC